MNSTLSLSYTYSYDKYSCLEGAWYGHIVFVYLVFFSGIGAMVSRAIPPLKFLHPWFGRGYISFMLINIGCSVVIHNEGLPAATLISFVWVLGGLVLAWILIVIYKLLFNSELMKRVDQRLEKEAVERTPLAKMFADETQHMLQEQTWTQRFFSLKSLHGALMFTSWINIAGRIFASNQSGFQCYTQPAYKLLNTSHFAGADAPITFVPPFDPNYARLPWAKLGTAGWGAVMLFVPLLVAFLFGLGFILVTQAIRRRQQMKSVSY